MDSSLQEEQQRPFSTEVERLATDHKLGTPQKSYTKMDSDRRLFVNAIVWITLSTLAVIFVIALVLRLTLPGPYVGLNSYLTAAVLGVVGFVILSGCFRQGLLNLHAYQYRNREQVHIYTDGLVYLEGQAASQVVRWEWVAEFMRGEIDDEATGKVSLDSIYMKMDSGVDRAANREAQIFFQPALPQRLEICEQIEQAYTDTRLPTMQARYRNGESLAFSELTIDQAGISLAASEGEPARIAWDQLTIKVEQPYTTVKVQSRGTWFKDFTCEIANACLLKALLEEVGQ